jgi:hypothetical protein
MTDARGHVPDSVFPFVRDGVHILPVLHERIEYADLVRLAMAELEPDAVAVEVPSSLETRWIQGVDRLPAASVLLYETGAGQTIYLPIQPADPMVEAARAARERGVGVCCADLDVDGYADYRDPVPDAYALLRLGVASVLEAFRQLNRPRDRGDRPREACMAYHARRLRSAGAERVLLVCGMHHADGVARQLERDQGIPLTPPVRKNVRLVHLHPQSLAEVWSELPFYVAAYEARRRGWPAEPEHETPEPAGRSYGPFRVLSGGRGDDPQRMRDAVARAARQGTARTSTWPASGRAELPGPVDRLRLQWSLVRESERALAASSPDEEVQAWQRRLLARYTRNLALASGRLVVDLFDLLAAARGCVSENFAWELHRLAVAYPPQGETARDLATARIRADELYDGVRRLRLFRRIRRPKRPDWRRLFRRGRRSERWAGEWLEGFDVNAICSYPPEDILVEDFGRYLRGRGKSVLSEEQARTVPFTTSVLDGIDVRETIRNWHEGRIMVRELGRAPGEVGSVIVIFDDESPRDEPRYPYLQTWHGEHDQESDMAFYCTDPAQGIVGPGICRTTYGGFLLSHPPRRMADVWTDPDYRMAESKAEVLLLAGIDYTTEPMVVYVAARPPRSILFQLAARMDLKIVYLPLGSLSPATLKRIRVMHILSGQDKRGLARDYIW